jgi:hypothetical protein
MGGQDAELVAFRVGEARRVIEDQRTSNGHEHTLADAATISADACVALAERPAPSSSPNDRLRGRVGRA